MFPGGTVTQIAGDTNVLAGQRKRRPVVQEPDICPGLRGMALAAPLTHELVELATMHILMTLFAFRYMIPAELSCLLPSAGDGAVTVDACNGAMRAEEGEAGPLMLRRPVGRREIRPFRVASLA